jgi:glycosyltransferase involved in cell wall biosynthesis
MEAQLPLVSVLCLSYNQMRFVEVALDSIKAQTYKNIELLIADDRSSDDSPQVITDWLQRENVNAQTFFHTQNYGVCKTLNELLANSHGEWIAILAADDYWEPHHLQTLVECAVKMPDEYGVIYSDALQVNEEGESLGVTFISDHIDLKLIPDGDIFNELADRNWLCAITTLVRRSCYSITGQYDERLIYEDYDMWLRMAQYFKFNFIRETTANTRIVNTSITRQHLHKRTIKAEISDFYISRKLIKTNRLTPELRAKHAMLLIIGAKNMFRLRSKGRARFMIIALRYIFSWKLLFKALLSMFKPSLFDGPVETG